MEKEIAQILRANKKTLSLAESCTGGLVSSRITDVPGISAFFVGGVVAYSNTVKKNILKVPEGLLEKYGAVSPETAKKMASGVRGLMRTDFSAAITGIAGPGGGTQRKPVGVAYIAFSSDSGSEVKKILVEGSRKDVKNQFADEVLKLIKDSI